MKLYQLLLLIPLTACASISDGSRQIVQVKTMQGFKAVPAHCIADNGIGQAVKIAQTPDFIGVNKSRNPLGIDCTSLDGRLHGHQELESYTTSQEIGSFLGAGLIGIGVDAATGAANKYPEQVTVEMANLKVPPLESPSQRSVST